MGVHKSPIEKEVPSAFSRWFFCWMFPMCYSAQSQDLEEHDLVRAKYQYDSQKVGDKLEKNWLSEEAKAKKLGRDPSFTKVILKTFWLSTMPAAILQLLYVAIRTVTPLLFAELLTYWSVDTTLTQLDATYYAVAMILGNWVAAFCNHHGNLLGQQCGMQMRVATSTLMYRKIMRMDNASLGDTTAGKVVNLLSNDLQRLDLAFTFIHYGWIIPLQLIAILYLSYVQAGVSAFIGIIAIIVLALPLQGVLTRSLGKYRSEIAERTDDRIKIMSEVINGIQVIKMYAWEIPFDKVVTMARSAEADIIKKATLLRTAFLGFMIFTERTALFLTILTYVLLGNSVSATVIYPLQQFMSAIQINITLILPLVLAFTVEMLVAFRRVQEFMSLNDRPDLSPLSRFEVRPIFRRSKEETTKYAGVRPLSYERRSSSIAVPQVNGASQLLQLQMKGRRFSRSMSVSTDIAIEVRDVSCSWTGDPKNLALKNISLRVRRGKLCAVIGPVGSGKSSLLQLLLKELAPIAGSASAFGTMSYSCQEPWLFPATVRENILFGLPYDADKYKRVCKACALEKDFKQFTYGDQTIVGERGVSMSGGQRARVNLARAVYRDCDIYLLDDPLSAVDANVGRQLFEGCINGYLRNKTRVLVTHQIHFLKAADIIVVLNNGTVENMGSFDELAASGRDFATMLAQLQEGKDKDSDSTGSGGSSEEKPRLSRSGSKSLQRTVSRTFESEKAEIEEFEEQTVQAEERQSGNLKWSVVEEYFRAAGICVTITAIFLAVLTIAAAAGADYWVSYWTNQMAVYEESLDGAPLEPGLDVQVGLFTTGQYLLIHGGIVVACLLLANIRVFPFATLCTNASKRLHNKMFSTMLQGIMRFFDTSSSGRILNRFTKDMGALDEILPRTLLEVLQIYATLAAVLVLNAIALYYTLIPSVVLLLVFALTVNIYMKTAQGIKRLEGTTKSPVFGTVTSSLNGIATIRSSGAEARLIANFDNMQDIHTCAWNSYLCGGSTFALYLDTLCLIYLATVIFVCLYIDFDGLLPVGSVGLVVTQSNTLTAMLQHGARMLVEFIAQLTSVERVLEYTKIETEANLFHGVAPTPPAWPSNGRLEFRNVNLKYAVDEPPVLKGLNIVIEPAWKIGIVGRTGAGKSSLISAMFRFAYIDGDILIDGLDTSLISRQDLRSKISIIPQEPVLFSATIRYNLDPFDIYTDEELWRALEQVEMKSAIPSLEYMVTEGGANFSVGQRQLMCLARAVLRSNKILIMDEATANVDPQTDNFIQGTIRRAFASCTVLTIAHRLNTVMDSDRVLVMDSGQVAEFEHPFILLSDPNSALSSMVRETGDKMAKQLLEVAREAYFQSNLKENAR